MKKGLTELVFILGKSGSKGGLETDTIGGSTALLDAIGRKIHEISNAKKHTADDYRAEKVIIVIIMDVEENFSREYSAEKIKTQIERQKKNYWWEFIFLGANIAVEMAGRFGISADRAQNYHADSEGVKLNFRVMSEAVATFRECTAMPEGWNDEIKKDYKRRGGRKLSIDLFPCTENQ